MERNSPAFKAMKAALRARLPQFLEGTVDSIYHENMLEYILDKIEDIITDEEMLEASSEIK